MRHTSVRVVQLAVALGAASTVVGCGGSDGDEDGEAPGAGQVTESFREYCVATFTEQRTVMDVFDEPLFTARAGEEYLLAEWGPSFGEDRAEMLYLTPSGPEVFAVTAPEGMGLPLESSCEFGETMPYYAAFTDVEVYADAAFAEPLCSLARGSVVPRDTTRGSGYSLVQLVFQGPAAYEVMLNGFGAQCGGAERGYVRVPETRLFGTTTWLVPIQGIVGPALDAP